MVTHVGAATIVPATIVALALAAITATGAAAQDGGDARLEEFFGTYVGVAEVRDPPDGAAVTERDMDLVIGPYEDGFHIQWINVTRVDGRRDVRGVQRNVQEVRFKPAVDGADFYIEAPRATPFLQRDEMQPMRGDPVRWAAIEGDSLYVNSFVVLDDGRYELQLYERERTEEGIDLEFQRLLDGELQREIVGKTVRVDVQDGGGEELDE